MLDGFSASKFVFCVASCSSDSRVVRERASASEAVDSGLVASQVKPMTVKLVFTASLLDV